MKIADVPYSKRKSAPEIRAWGGLNRTQSASDGEVIDCRGIATDAYPALQVRKGRTRIGEWENATDVYETDGHMVVVDDNKLYYDGEFKSNVGSGKKQFAEINRNLVIWPDKIIINLNSGEVKNIEASISGSIGNTGNTMISIVDGRGKGSIELDPVDTWYEEAGPVQHIVHDYSYFLRVYTELSYANGWVYEGAKTVEAAFVGEGLYFIGSKPETRYYVTSNTPAWSMEGTVYGKITKVTTINEQTETHSEKGDDGNYYYVDYGRYGKRIEYELYDGIGTDLRKMFNVGDTVEIEGSKLLYNNKEAITLTGVGKTNLSMDAAMLPIPQAIYFNVTEDLPEGMYFLHLGNTGTNYGYFKSNRTIRAGEQIFRPANAGGGLELAVYTYDPVIQKLEKQETGTNTGAKSLIATNYAQPESGVTISSKVPDMDYICEHNNRLYGVSNNEEEKIFNTQTEKYETVKSRVLHASALGQPTRWNEFAGAATDSYAVAVAGEGDFTGIISYSGNVIAFKEDKMYKLSGDYPAEFFLRSYNIDGVKEGCHKTMVIINEVLYYLSPYGVMSYSGGVPGLISYNLDLLKFEEGTAGRDRTNYYISMRDSQNGFMIYRYDTVRGFWTIESAEEATSVERVGDYAYACIGGKIWKMADEGSQEVVAWTATLPETDEGAFEKKRYQFLRLIADVDGSLTVKCRQNDHTEWQELGTITEKGKKIHALPMDTIRCDRIQFKLEGEGKATIWAMERRFTVGSER